MVDLVQGAPDLIAYGAADAQLRRAGDRRCRADQGRRRRRPNRRNRFGLTTLYSRDCAVWGVLAVGIPAVADGQLTGVLLAVVVLIPLAAFELVVGLPSRHATLERVRRSADRVIAVLDAPRPGPSSRPIRCRCLLRRTRSGFATFARRYPSGRSRSTGRPRPPAGRRVAVVGPSGAGKSTLAAVLVRFLDLESGTATLNGVPLRDLGRR